MEAKGNEMPRSNGIRVTQRITWIGLVVNVLLSALKFVTGYFGHSQAVIADAVHSLSDTTTDLAVLLGVKYWTAPPDEDHPYGHRRIETLITAFIGFVLAIVAVGLAREAIMNIQSAEEHVPGWIAIIGAGVSIISKEILYRVTVRTGRQHKSPALIANAWHHRSDAISSVPALIAVVAAVIDPRLAVFDHVGAILVSAFILKVSWDITYPALKELTDAGAGKKDKDVIVNIALGVDGVITAHAIRSRMIGQFLHVDLHIEVDADMSVYEGHEIATTVKHRLIEEGPNIADVVVHIEPYLPSENTPEE